MRNERPASPVEFARRIQSEGLDALRPLLHGEPPALRLEPSQMLQEAIPEIGTLAPAAVLVPIVCRSEPTILFTQRTSHLSRHAGQVSFPGGRAHVEDRSLVETALRETREETGIESSYVHIAGFLDPQESGSGYAILPVVGLLDVGFTIEPDANEVAEIFEVPVAFLLERENFQTRSIEVNGAQRFFYAVEYEGHYIWGITAGMLMSLRERIMG